MFNGSHVSKCYFCLSAGWEVNLWSWQQSCAASIRQLFEGAGCHISQRLYQLTNLLPLKSRLSSEMFENNKDWKNINQWMAMLSGEFKYILTVLSNVEWSVCPPHSIVEQLQVLGGQHNNMDGFAGGKWVSNQNDGKAGLHVRKSLCQVGIRLSVITATVSA